MRISYVGNRSFKTRLAEFSYKDGEEEKFMEICRQLEELGYKVDTGVANWACIEVEDRQEYEQVARDYLKIKRTLNTRGD